MRMTRKSAASRHLSPIDEIQPKKRKVVRSSREPLATRTRNKTVEAKPIEVKPVFDYDGVNRHPGSVHRFAFDIFRYMKYQEARYQLTDYLRNPATVMSSSQRSVVVDWLVECHEAYNYTHETMYISVRLFDIYISKNPTTPINRLQLVACTAFLIASKYEEYEPVQFVDLVSICSNLYKKEDFIKMERRILTAAGCDLGFPLSYSFLRRYSRVIETTMQVLTLARFILEVSLHCSGFAFLSPSKIAAASLVLSLEKHDLPSSDWGSCLEYYSEHSIAELKKLARQLDSKIKNFREVYPKCLTVIEKYMDETFYEVAKMFYD